MGERLAVMRGGEWWDYKLVPIVSVFYATAFLLGRPVSELWANALLLLLSLIPGAAYVSIVNDVTDIDEDRAAGKANRMAGRSLAFKSGALALPIAGGGLFFWLWRGDPLLLVFYGCAWIAFTLYSVPPIRLKTRGFAGIIADAAGAHLFPTLLAAALPFVTVAAQLDLLWLAAVGVWSMGYGLRGNLWHQLLDRDSDRAASIRTFGARHSPALSARLGAWLALPLELAGLALMFWRIGSPLPLLFLGVYLLLIYRRVKAWGMKVIVVEPKPRYLILLHEYYDVFLPLAVLAACALVHPADWAVLAVHLLLFHRRPIETWRDGWRVAVLPLLRKLGLAGAPT